MTVAVTEPLPAPAAPVSVTASAVRLTPAKPKAGARLVARVQVTAGGTPVRPAGVSCAATLGGRKLAGVPRATSGAAACTYRVPKGSKGKTLRGTVAFIARAKRFVKRFSATVA